MARIIRAELRGPEAELGRIPAGDVAKLIIGLERALARAAYVALGRQRAAGTGRHKAAIERASRLRFVGVQEGSVVELLALPEAEAAGDSEMPFDVGSLGDAAFDQLARALTHDNESVDSALADAVAQLSEELGVGERHDEIALAEADPHDLSRKPKSYYVIDSALRRRMRSIADQPPTAREDTVVGRLFEADFEKMTAHLRAPTGQSVTVTFPEEMADQVQDALRQPAQLIGRVEYDPKTSVARSIEMQRVTRADQLAFDDQAFRAVRTVAEYAREQGIDGPPDISRLRDPDMTDEERDAFLADYAEA